MYVAYYFDLCTLKYMYLRTLCFAIMQRRVSAKNVDHAVLPGGGGEEGTGLVLPWKEGVGIFSRREIL